MALDQSQRRLLSAARSYLGVKWRHRGRSRVGVDCAGLVWCMYRDCGVSLPDRQDYGRNPFQDGLEAAIVDAVGNPVWRGTKGACMRDFLRPADVVVMAPASQPRHVGIIGDDLLHGLSLIHAEGAPGPGKTVELGLSSTDLGLIVSIYRKALP